MPGPQWRARAVNRLSISCRLLPQYVCFALLKHLIPLRTLTRVAWRNSNRRLPAAEEALVVSRVLRASALLGLPDRDCLQRSLLLYRELSRTGADPSLVVGLRQREGRVEGHAWVTSRNQIIAESPEALASFTPALVFGRDGHEVSVTQPVSD